MAVSSIPATRAAAVAAAAFSRLCGPGISGSAGSSSSAAKPTRRARPGIGPNARGTTAVSSAPCRSKMRSFTSAYASKEPCRSRWSGSRLRRTATRGRSVSTSSSWNDESSHTTHASGEAEPTRDVSGRPTLPATSTGVPADRKTAPSSSVVVVLPFVPVTPRIGFGRSRAPSSISLHTGTERARALATSSVSPGTPGLFTTRSIPCSSVSSSRPR